jgi:hypothetical protein
MHQKQQVVATVAANTSIVIAAHSSSVIARAKPEAIQT